MNDQNLLSVENLGKQKKNSNRKSKKLKSLEKGTAGKLRASKSEDLHITNGILPLEPLKDYLEPCKCNKCQPEEGKEKKKEDNNIRDGIVTSDLDSSSSRSTLKLRARSWPLLIPPQEANRDSKKELGFPSPVAQVRRLLWRHYYPEGGWGYVVVTCCVLVQILNHGLQLAYGIFHKPIFAKFQVEIQETAAGISAAAEAIKNLEKITHVDTRCGRFRDCSDRKAKKLGRAVGRCDNERRGANVRRNPTDAPVGSGSSGEEDSDIPPARKGLYRSRSLPHLISYRDKFDSGVGCSGSYSGADQDQELDGGSVKISNCQKIVYDLRQLLTLKQHYYPEGGWGWIVVVCAFLVQCLSHGLHGASGIILQHVVRRFEDVEDYEAGWLGALSTAVALLLSPITIAFCRRKSTRVTAVVGGLITALGCLFTSFASQFHQLFFSYGTVIGVGVSLTRDCSTLMVAQYFKRRRELVEIFIVSGSGLGISIMSACIQGAINAIGWRLGLQAVTGAIFLTFILGTFYRSASLYHPQRRAILHLKNQKRKIKDKNKVEEKPAFLDMTALKSKTVRILLASTGLSAFGINTPIFYLARQAEQEGLGERAVLLQAYLGLAWVLGCAAFGLVVVHNSIECRIARQYLCQAAVFMCGLSILALTAVHGNYHGYVLFVWIYGIFCGGYHYSLKMYTYEKVRARNFAKTWGFVQCSQAIPIALGVPISGYMNEGCGGKAGYYFSSTCTLAGSLVMFLIDVHRRRIARHKHTKANGQRHLCESDTCPRRRPSIGAEPDPEPPLAELPVAELIPGIAGEKPELTCISEEGIADMDLPDNLLDDLDYIGITSCNKVENYLMLSEFENNLIAETPVVLDKRGRRWSLARRSEEGTQEEGGRWRLVPPKRTITVIDEASV